MVTNVIPSLCRTFREFRLTKAMDLLAEALRHNRYGLAVSKMVKSDNKE
jgi:hypothetical protein